MLEQDHGNPIVRDGCPELVHRFVLQPGRVLVARVLGQESCQFCRLGPDRGGMGRNRRTCGGHSPDTPAPIPTSSGCVQGLSRWKPCGYDVAYWPLCGGRWVPIVTGARRDPFTAEWRYPS